MPPEGRHRRRRAEVLLAEGASPSAASGPARPRSQSVAGPEPDKARPDRRARWPRCPEAARTGFAPTRSATSSRPSTCRDTPVENVSRRRSAAASTRRTLAARTRGLGDRLHYRPRQLSVGQQQRGAGARARRPSEARAGRRADGNLDPVRRRRRSTFSEVCRATGAACVVSHDTNVLSRFPDVRDPARSIAARRPDEQLARPAMMVRAACGSARSTLVTVAPSRWPATRASVYAIRRRRRGVRRGRLDYDAVLGARGSQLSSLNTVFHLETSPGNIPWSLYQAVKKDSRVTLAAVRGGGQLQGLPHRRHHAEAFRPTAGDATRTSPRQGRFRRRPAQAVIGSFAAAKTGLRRRHDQPYHDLVYDERLREESTRWSASARRRARRQAPRRVDPLQAFRMRATCWRQGGARLRAGHGGHPRQARSQRGDAEAARAGQVPARSGGQLAGQGRDARFRSAGMPTSRRWAGCTRCWRRGEPRVVGGGGDLASIYNTINDAAASSRSCGAGRAANDGVLGHRAESAATQDSARSRIRRHVGVMLAAAARVRADRRRRRGVPVALCWTPSA